MRIDISIRNCLNRIEASNNVIELRKNLNQMISFIQKGIDLKLEMLPKQSMVARKGLLRIAKSTDSKTAFICGQYASTIEHMVDAYEESERNSTIKEAIQSVLAQEIIKYLWKHKCSEFDTLAASIKLTTHEPNSIVYKTVKANEKDIECVLESLFDVGIVYTDYTQDARWIELTAVGYEYVRKHYFEKEGFNLW